MNPKLKRFFFFSCGSLSLILGTIGIFLPILPTVPFVLLAAFCFSRSNERIHQWMLDHPYMGPFIKAWRLDGIIPIKIKFLATFLVTLSFGATIIFVKVKLIIKLIVLSIGISLLTYIWTRPHQKKR